MDFDPAAQELDRLFNMTQRGPFAGYQPGQISDEVGSIELTPGGITEDQAFPLYLQSYIIGGIYNDRFIASPPDGTGTYIDDIENKLPGWRFVDGSTNGSRVKWVDDGAGTGTLTFYMTNAVTDDDVYIEQLVYVPGGNINILSIAGLFVLDDLWTDVDVKPFISYTPVYADGSLGTETRAEYTNANEDAVHRLWYATRTKGYAFLRIRFGYTIIDDGSFTASELPLGTLEWTWVDDPECYDVTLRFGRGTSGSNFTPTASTSYAIELVDTAQTYGAAKWMAPSPGMVLAISVMNDHATGITGGQFDWFPRVTDVSGTTTEITDPVANFNYSEGRRKYAIASRDLSGSAAFDFFRTDRIDIAARTNAFYSGPGANWSGTVHLRMVFDTDAAGTGGGWGPAGG